MCVHIATTATTTTTTTPCLLLLTSLMFLRTYKSCYKLACIQLFFHLLFQELLSITTIIIIFIFFLVPHNITTMNQSLFIIITITIVAHFAWMQPMFLVKLGHVILVTINPFIEWHALLYRNFCPMGHSEVLTCSHNSPLIHFCT